MANGDPTDFTPREAAFCTSCPKLCRRTCPVSDATGREALIPGTKVAEAGRAVAAGGADRRSAEAAFACTGCLRCREACELGVSPGVLLVRHRADVVEAGLAPKVIEALARRFEVHGNVHGVDLAAALDALEAPDVPKQAAALFVGCAAATDPDEARSALAVSAGLGEPLRLERAEGRCCGAPLLAAGLLSQFKAAAKAFAQSLAPGRLYVLDPGCAGTLARSYPELGIALPVEVAPIVDLWADRAEKKGELPPLDEEVAYHDACQLGRGLGRYEQPRRALRAAGVALHEPRNTREHAVCSGAGGLLPWTMPKAAHQIAKTCGEELRAAAPHVVTACPNARRKLASAGTPTEGLASILARWLAGRPREP